MDILAVVSPIEILLAFIVYVGSFAAIPLLAKAFAGALNKLTGLVGDKSKGIFDRPRKFMEKRADSLRAGQESRKLGRRADRYQKKGTAGRWPGISAGRLLSGGHLLDSSLGEHTKDGDKKESKTRIGQYLQGRRRMADAAYEEQRTETHGNLVKQGQGSLAGRDFGVLEDIATSSSEPLYRQQAAIVQMAEAGAVTQLRNIIEHAENTPADKSKNLHIALHNALRSGVFYKEAMIKKAPDLARLSFEVIDKTTGKRKVEIKKAASVSKLQSIGNVSVKDSTDMDISTWRVALGLKSQKAKDVKETINLTDTGDSAADDLRAEMQLKIKELMDSENKLGRTSMTAQQRRLFKDVIEAEEEAARVASRRGRRRRRSGR